MERQRPEIQQKRAEWAQWQRGLSEQETRRLVFLDESSVDNVTFSREYGRAYEGRRAKGWFPKAKKHRVTVIVAVGWEGVLASYVVPGSATAKDFEFFMMHCLAPVIENHPSIVVMDNARIHHAVPEVEVSYQLMGHEWRFLPPYSPDFNPTENAFSKLKRVLTYFRFSLQRSPMYCVTKALTHIRAQNVQGWFQLCGYDK